MAKLLKLRNCDQCRYYEEALVLAPEPYDEARVLIAAAKARGWWEAMLVETTEVEHLGDLDVAIYEPLVGV